MGELLLLKILLTVSLLFLTGGMMTDAYAFGGFDILPDNPLWNFKIMGESIQEALTFDKKEKVELIQKHIDERDREKEAMFNMNKPVPDNLLSNRESKISETEKLVNELNTTESHSNFVSLLKAKIIESFGIQELSIIESKFIEIRNEDDPVKKRQLADELDMMVNKPLVTITCVGKIDSFEIAKNENWLDELKKQCVILNSITYDDYLQNRKVLDTDN